MDSVFANPIICRRGHLNLGARVPAWLKLGILVLLLLGAIGFAQTRSKRLILKDGSYQSSSKWEIKGDRVRYYSAERFMWEELPTALVDWAATEKYNKEVVSGETAADRAEAEADNELEEAASPKVAEGIRLPDYGGVYLLDTFNGQPQLVELVQNGGELNKQTGKNILRSVINPLPMGVKQTIELRAQRARIQSHTGAPEIYVNVDYGDTPDATTNLRASERFRMVRVQQKPKEDRRVVSNVKVALTGSMKEQRDLVPIRVMNYTTQWVKVSPAEPLPAGEYALIEMLTPTQMNLYVWDFGVDPKAPENPRVWKPAPPKQKPAGTDETPILTDRKKQLL
jgi:hypothetical protein